MHILRKGIRSGDLHLRHRRAACTRGGFLFPSIEVILSLEAALDFSDRPGRPILGSCAIESLVGPDAGATGRHKKAEIPSLGAFWNVVVGALCLGGRRLIKSGSRLSYGAGALAVGAALLIVMRTWLSGLLTARNPFPVVEALLIWPWLIYAFIYASSAILKQVRAEQSGST